MSSSRLQKGKFDLTRRFWREHIAQYWVRIVLIVLLMIVVAGTSATYPKMIEIATGWAEQGDRRVLTLAPIVIIIVVLIKAVSLLSQTILTQNLALKIVNDLQDRQFDALLKRDFGDFALTKAGSLASRFTNDMHLLRESLMRVANNLIRDLLTVIGVLSMLIYMNWQLTLLVLLLYPFAFFPVIRIGQLVRRKSTHMQEQAGDVTATVTQTVQNIELIKNYNLAPYEKKSGQRHFLSFREIAQRVAALRAVVDPLLEVAGGISFAIVLAFIGWQILNGQSSFGEFTGFVAGVAIIAPALRALGTMSAVVQEGYAALERAFEQMDRTPTITSPETPRIVPDKARGEVCFDQMDFRYQKSEDLLFENFSLLIAAGESVALVGPSGGGKTTLLKLISRLYDPVSGHVMIDGIETKDWPLEALRNQISVVSQQPEMFHASVAENIRLGRLDATHDDVENAAREAECSEFIAELPEGMETMIGIGGAGLSGGQRQRLALARAFLREAPILLLDEATSALDTQTEQKIQRSIAKLAKKCTTITIAHRLSTVRDVERILVIDGGKLVQEGRHKTLVTEKGLYKQLCDQQFAQ